MLISRSVTFGGEGHQAAAQVCGHTRVGQHGQGCNFWGARVSEAQGARMLLPPSAHASAIRERDALSAFRHNQERRELSQPLLGAACPCCLTVRRSVALHSCHCCHRQQSREQLHTQRAQTLAPTLSAAPPTRLPTLTGELGCEPMAETTMSLAWAGSEMMSLAASAMRSAVATHVPPNLCTCQCAPRLQASAGSAAEGSATVACTRAALRLRPGGRGRAGAAAVAVSHRALGGKAPARQRLPAGRATELRGLQVAQRCPPWLRCAGGCAVSCARHARGPGPPITAALQESGPAPSAVQRPPTPTHLLLEACCSRATPDSRQGAITGRPPTCRRCNRAAGPASWAWDLSPDCPVGSTWAMVVRLGRAAVQHPLLWVSVYFAQLGFDGY